MEPTTGKFEGYALVELMGHQSTAGFLTTKAFGPIPLFHVTAPEEVGPEEIITTRTHVNGEWLLPGSKIRRRRLAVDELVGINAIYRITACSAQTAQERQKVVTEIIERAAAPQIEAPDASQTPTQINVELLYANLTGLIDLSDYDSGVMDALGWVLRKEPRPLLDADSDSTDDGAEDIMDGPIAQREEEYTGF